MHRLLIVLLSAFDAVIAAATGLAVALATLTLLWVFGLGTPDWASLWPATVGVWQLGHLVPFTVRLPAEYVAAAGVPEAAASFAVSLAPLAFACFTAYRGVRSGIRAGRSGAWGTGVAGGAVAFAIAAVAVCLTARTPVAVASVWQAILFPVLVFALPCLAGAVGTVWRSDAGQVGRLREVVADLPGLWAELPALAVRGVAVVLVALSGMGALGVIAALLLRGDQIVALYQSANLDVMGVIVVSLAQLAYLPTLVVWAASFVAGPGFALGTGTAVSPAGTQLGVVPGIPVLGALPETASPWLLVIVLLPIGAGALAGWMLRDRMLRLPGGDDYGVRAGATGAVALLSAGAAALAAWFASGAFGPGRLADIGPNPGAVALAVGVEVLVGCGILLLSPDSDAARRVRSTRGRAESGGDLGETRAPSPDGARPFWDKGDLAGTRAPSAGDVHPGWDRDRIGGTRAPSAGTTTGEDDIDTAPIDPGFLGGDGEIRP